MSEQENSLRENLRTLPRSVWILFFGTFLNKFGAFVLPFLAIYMGQLGYSIPQSGMAIAGYGVGTLVACLVGGHLADRFGRRCTIVFSMFSVSLVMLCLSQARSLPMIVALATLAGLTGELYRPAASALLADLVPSGQRVTAFAAYRLAFNAGWAFGPATAGLLAKSSFLWLFIGDAATSLLYGFVAWFALPSHAHTRRESQSWLDTWTVLREDRAFRQAICASLAVGLVFVQAFSTFSLEITQHGFSASTYGLLISLNGVLVVLCELPLTTITRRFPARKVMAIGYLLTGLGFASNLTERSLPLLVMTIVLFTFGEMVAMPVSGAYVADLAPADRRGLYMGAWGGMWSLAFICGPSLGMLLFAQSPSILWISCGLLGILAAVIITAEPRRQVNIAPLVSAK
jgi:MFS family permease